MIDRFRGGHICRHLLVGLVLAGFTLPPSHARAHEVLNVIGGESEVACSG